MFNRIPIRKVAWSKGDASMFVSHPKKVAWSKGDVSTFVSHS